MLWWHPPDLRFAARQAVAHRANLRQWHDDKVKVVEELQRRLAPISRHLRKFQHSTVKQVTANLHLAMIGMAVVLMCWNDYTLPAGFITGFSLLTMPRTGVFVPIEEEEPASIAWLLQRNPAVLEQEMLRPLPEHQQAVWQSCIEEHAKGYGGKLCSEEELNTLFGGRGKWAAVPCFPHVQPIGRIRRIDNAKKPGHNRCTQYVERQHYTNATQPLVDAQLLQEEAELADVDLHSEGHCMETGGGDCPDAFRGVPVCPEEQCVNIVAPREPETGQLSYVPMWALLFGFRASVLQYGRWRPSSAVS